MDRCRMNGGFRRWLENAHVDQKIPDLRSLADVALEQISGLLSTEFASLSLIFSDESPFDGKVGAW